MQPPRGQTGSDQGQTRVRPGSDRGQTPTSDQTVRQTSVPKLADSAKGMPRGLSRWRNLSTAADLDADCSGGGTEMTGIGTRMNPPRVGRRPPAAGAPQPAGGGCRLKLQLSALETVSRRLAHQRVTRRRPRRCRRGRRTGHRHTRRKRRAFPHVAGDDLGERPVGRADRDVNGLDVVGLVDPDGTVVGTGQRGPRSQSA